VSQASNPDLDKMLDKVKAELFLGTNAAFLGSIMCSVEFLWDETFPTAWTDYLRIGWNPHWFLSTSHEKRKGLLLHELWHIARLHQLRRGTRDPKMWNIGCDYRINNDLITSRQPIPDGGCVAPQIDDNGILSEEEIYDLLMQNSIPVPADPMEDLRDGEQNGSGTAHAQMIATVVRAVQAAEMAKMAGELPGDIKQMLNTFLEPVVPWRTVLQQWMTELLDEDFTWKKRNRRYDIYMPSREEDEGRLEHLVYFQDTSGSITEKDMLRFNSEVKYVQEVLKPKKLTLIQFDTMIQFVREFIQDELFEDVEFHGGGGTCLVPVRAWIEEYKPTAAIIFSDLECSPMKPLTQKIPVIWAVIRNRNIPVHFGKVIHIKD
jgi:predicted metal-dependent peptidase